MASSIRDDKRTEELKLRLTAKEHRDLWVLAAADGRTVAEMARVLIRRALYGAPELRNEAPASNDAPAVVRKVPKRRLQVFNAAGGKCAYCSAVLRLDGKWHIDHRMPRALMGSDEPTNLTAACVPCNLAKRDRTDVEFKAARAA